MKLLNLVKRVKDRIFKVRPSEKFPFQFHNDYYSLIFEINNHIEGFRLANWGGERDYVINLVEELKEDDVLYDIGSSVGLISVISASVLKRGKVVSFEPDPENLKRLKRNYSINKLNNFLVQQVAVGETKGKLELFTQGSNGFSPSLKPVNGIDKHIEVEVNSIDNLIGNKIIPYPDVVKIDIEGAEFMALKGMEELLSSDKRPRLIFLEVHPKFLPAFNCTPQDIYDYLGKFNYTIAENIQREEQILCKLVSN